MDADEQQKVMVAIKIPPDLRVRLRLHCIRNEIGVSEYIEALIRQDLDAKEEMITDWLTES